MESGRGSGGGLRAGPGGKKMRKRKELDALVGGVSGGKRTSGGSKRAGSGGISPQDQLLSESTGEEEYWSSKGSKGRRRYIGSGASGPSKPCTALLRVCTILLVMACLVATLTVMWLFIDIREQTTYLHNQLDQVVAGSQGVPDALQKCHSMSRELQNNQTKLFAQLASLTQNVSGYTTQIVLVKASLSSVEEKLKASPELVNLPHELQQLAASVASFGSQIQDLQTTTSRLQEQQARIFDKIKIIQLNISGIHKVLSDLKAAKDSFYQAGPNGELAEAEKRLENEVNSLRTNVTNINDTLARRLQYTFDDEHRDHKIIEDLREMSANLSSRLTTLQNDCTNQMDKIQHITSNINDYSHQVVDYSRHVEDLGKQMAVLSEQYRRLENSTVYMSNEMSQLRSSFHDLAETGDLVFNTTLQHNPADRQ